MRKSAGPFSGSSHDKRRTSPRGGIARANRARTCPVLASLSFPLAFCQDLRQDYRLWDCRLCRMGSSYISKGDKDAHRWSAPSCI
jgi:hypothetical protein